MKIKKRLFLGTVATAITTVSLTPFFVQEQKNKTEYKKINFQNLDREIDSIDSKVNEINNLSQAIAYFNSNNVSARPSNEQMILLKEQLKGTTIELLWKNITINNIYRLLNEIAISKISNENKLWLVYALKIRLQVLNFVGQKANERTRRSTEEAFILSAKVPAEVTEITPEMAFGVDNLRPLQYLLDKSGQPITINGQPITVQGADDRSEDWHAFNPDITIINWSNKGIYTKISDFIYNSASYIEFKTTYDRLKENIQILSEVEKQNRFTEIAQIAAKFRNSEIFRTASSLFRKVSRIIGLFDFLKDASDLSQSRPFYDAIGESAVKNLAPIGVALAASSVAGGPVGAALGLISNLILNIIPTPNGYTASSNMFDHGLNDFSFQMQHNTANMLGIALAFSEDLSHGISWKVEDAMFETPNLWIRPGQVADQPWTKLSIDYTTSATIETDSSGSIQYVPRMPVKTFVWGEPVQLQGFTGLTELRNYYNNLGTNTNNLKQIYQDIVEVDFTKEYNLIYADPRNTGQMYSDYNRDYEISFKYWYEHNEFPFTPTQSVHENDHDDDSSVKHGKWTGELPGSGIEIMNDLPGFIRIYFENGQRLTLRDTGKMMDIAYEKAKMYTQFVLSYGFPTTGTKMESDSSTFTGTRPGFTPFSPDKQYIVKYYVKSFGTSETRFNTYDDSGWDDTHSDNFRFTNPSIGINVEFFEVQNPS